MEIKGSLEVSKIYLNFNLYKAFSVTTKHNEAG
jgi:hypothetical protein